MFELASLSEFAVLHQTTYIHPGLAAGKIGLSRPIFTSIRRYLAPDFGLEGPTAGDSYSLRLFGRFPETTHTLIAEFPN
jgi:hypothetical protein